MGSIFLGQSSFYKQRIMIYKTQFTCFIYALAEKKISNFKILGDKYIEGKIKGAFLFQRSNGSHLDITAQSPQS